MQSWRRTRAIIGLARFAARARRPLGWSVGLALLATAIELIPLWVVYLAVAGLIEGTVTAGGLLRLALFATAAGGRPRAVRSPRRAPGAASAAPQVDAYAIVCAQERSWPLLTGVSGCFRFMAAAVASDPGATAARSAGLDMTYLTGVARPLYLWSLV